MTVIIKDTGVEFRAWPKTPRLYRDIVVTEKIDGTNAAVIVGEDGSIGAQSRNRLITPDADNFGFASWVAAYAGALVDTLGPGHHYGEWYGSGIQRGYGLTGGEKRFALFNVPRWADEALDVDGLECVPVLYTGPFSTAVVDEVLSDLAAFGSHAAPFASPEGVVVFHTASRQTYKVLIENDHLPKGIAA